MSTHQRCGARTEIIDFLVQDQDFSRAVFVGPYFHVADSVVVVGGAVGVKSRGSRMVSWEVVDMAGGGRNLICFCSSWWDRNVYVYIHVPPPAALFILPSFLLSLNKQG